MKKIIVIQVAFSSMLVSVCWSSPVQTEAANSENSVRASWSFGVEAEDVALGHGLPVLALDGPDWPSYRTETNGTARAMRSMRAELTATHPSGWQLAALVRSAAWLEASDDAVTVAALDANHADPSFPRSFKLAARGQSWQGFGLKVGTPWWSMDDTGVWRWQADAQLLNLRQLRTVEIAGDISYSGGGAYDFNVRGQRSNTGITGPFLPASDRTGFGASLSFALEGEPVSGWRVQLRADDLFSRLKWGHLATDASVLNSQVTSRTPDGSLDYAALLNGRKSLAALNERIGPHWQTKISWSLSGADQFSGALTLRADDWAGLQQYWFGWDSLAGGKAMTRWVLELEPQLHAVSAGLSWGNWRAVMGTDGKGNGTEYRRFSIGWRADL